MVTAPTNGRYEPGTGPVLLLIHGAGGNHESFARLWPFLPENPRWAVDLPGRGDGPAEPCGTVSEAAQWVMRMCEKHGFESVCIAGHSFGGAVALECALQFPERMLGLVLMATGARLRLHPALMAMLQDAAGRDQQAPTPAGLWQEHTPQAVIDASEKAGQCVSPQTQLTDWQAADRFDRMEEVAAIQVSTLIIGGHKDQLTPPKYSQYLADKITNSTLIQLANDGHLFPIENPGQTGTLLRRFMDELKSG